MADSLSTTPFDRWQSLLSQWEIAYAHYLDATEAKKRVLGLGGAVDDLEKIEKRAFENLNDIKSEMGGLIASAGNKRGKIKDSLVIGMIDPNPAKGNKVPMQVRKDTGKS